MKSNVEFLGWHEGGKSGSTREKSSLQGKTSKSNWIVEGGTLQASDGDDNDALSCRVIGTSAKNPISLYPFTQAAKKFGNCTKLFVRNKIAHGYCARASLRTALRVGAL